MQGLITIKSIGDTVMKKMLVMAMMMVMTISVNAMSYTVAKNEALFLSDKMAYELNLTDAQYEAVYGSTWRVTNAGNAHRSSATVRANGHSHSATSGDALLAKNGNRQMAMNTNRNGNGNSHFGGRR